MKPGDFVRIAFCGTAVNGVLKTTHYDDQGVGMLTLTFQGQIGDGTRIYTGVMPVVVDKPGVFRDLIHGQTVGIYPLVFHIMSQGTSLCNRPGTPKDWPPGHEWVALRDIPTAPPKARCELCMAQLNLALAVAE